MKRYTLTPYQTDAEGARFPVVPANATSWVRVEDIGNRALVKATVPDGSPVTANTIADITMDEDGRQIDINAAPLTPAQRTAAKTFLANQGMDVSRFDEDAPDDRAKLLRFVLRRLAGWKDISVRELLDGWDA